MTLPERHSAGSALLRRWTEFALVVLLTGLIAACTTDDDEGDETPTAPPATLSASSPGSAAQPSPTSGGLRPVATSSAAVTVVPATLSASNGQTISDGVCTATVPDGWVDDGTGHGTTLSGARYELFGGRLKSDDDWNKAVDLVKEQAKTIKDAKVSDDDDFVRVDLPDSRGFEYRGRLEDRYCDFSVTSTSRPVPPDEQAFWDAIIASLSPAQ